MDERYDLKGSTRGRVTSEAERAVWAGDNLPTDRVSVENGAIVEAVFVGLQHLLPHDELGNLY